jgi:hypothetical protein
VKWDGGDLSTAFHTFGVEWDANAVKWYVDGTVRRTYARPEADEFLNQWNDHTAGAYMMLNVHAKNATWNGGNLSCSNLPRYMEVDYVRAYQKSGTTTPPPTPTGLLQNPGFETGTLSPWTSWGNSSIGDRAASGRAAGASWPGGTAPVEQVVTGLTPNTTYYLRGWGKVDAAGISARLSVKDHGGTQVYSPNFTSPTSYTQSSVTFTTGSSSTSARVMVYAPPTAARGDDFTARPGTGSRVAYARPKRRQPACSSPNPAGRQFRCNWWPAGAGNATGPGGRLAGRLITGKFTLAGRQPVTVKHREVRPGTYLIGWNRTAGSW